MLSIHFNGDVVRHPNTKRILTDKFKYSLTQGKNCKFGVKEAICATFQDWIKEIPRERIESRCELCNKFTSYKDKDGFIWKNYKCPKQQSNYLNSIKAKSFKIDAQVYRKMSSSAHYLIKSSSYKTIFITLTFPKFKKLAYDNKNRINERKINSAFSKFMENLRTNYNCSGYVAVREFGDKNSRVHFHCLLSMPYVPFITLNRAWCHAIQNISYFAANALTTKRKSIYINNPVKAVKYVCKYFSKSKGTTSKTRIVFISKNIIIPSQKFDGSSNKLLDSYKFDYMRHTSDYTTIFRITDEENFIKFCNDVIYPFFSLDSSPVKFFSFPNKKT